MDNISAKIPSSRCVLIIPFFLVYKHYLAQGGLGARLVRPTDFVKIKFRKINNEIY